MAETIQGLKGAEVYMDDILVDGETEDIHDRRLERVLKVIEPGLKLNRAKWKFKEQQICFPGHIFDESAVSET